MSASQLDIGVTMIARNAASNIGCALNSVRNFARHIVVVDTGSLDATPQIAAAMGAEVHFHKWCDDFSESRNYALSAARTEWILQLDADEEVADADIASISYIISDAQTGGATVRIINELQNGTSAEHRFTRLFRNRGTIRYEGRIHEQIAPAIRAAGFDVADLPLVIRHYGYAAPDNDERTARNIRLLEEELREKPNDVWLMHHLGMALFAAKRHERAAKILRSIADSVELSDEQREISRIRAAQSAIALGDNDKAAKMLEFGCSSAATEGFRLYVKGLLLGLNGRFTEATEHLSQPTVKMSCLVNLAEAEYFEKRFSSAISGGYSSTKQ
ncbi:hypothetical protein MASR2M18_12310 [Ignavibacteria bacterium]